MDTLSAAQADALDRAEQAVEDEWKHAESTAGDMVRARARAA